MYFTQSFANLQYIIAPKVQLYTHTKHDWDDIELQLDQSKIKKGSKT